MNRSIHPVLPHPEHERTALALLASPPFVLAVALLLLNDHVLKAAYGNWVTGKLSDFAGLFAFALFWTALLPHRRGVVFALTAIGFVLWKTPLTDSLLAAWNALGVLPLARVVDYTDWVALLALVPAYHLARRPAAWPAPPLPRQLRRALAVASAAVAMLAFSATSILRPTPIPDLHQYEVPATRGQIGDALQELSLLSRDRPSAGRSARPDAVADTLVVRIRQPPERRIEVWVEVAERTPGASTLRLVAVQPEGPRPATESIHRAFTAQVYQPLTERLTR